ncbi:carbon storage regulator [Microbulbifer aggregans]|uniref:carbon storage regulator n=1 Tax=Microbulbifer aggregans TaxID=1769779 RepID=UPI001CFCADE8|nr:carbon storage regulator [Microbulbifer aggregans]
MLVLTRRQNETVVIGDNLVRFKILSVERDQVKVAILADKSISIHREEIFDQIKNESPLEETAHLSGRTILTLKAMPA